jgi:hypothetical protein
MFRRFFRSQTTQGFRARSLERDQAADTELIDKVGNAILEALHALEKEREGLSGRITRAQVFASIVVGNEVDDHATREPQKTKALTHYESEMRKVNARLAELETYITDLKFLRAVFATRFEKLAQRREDPKL